MSLNLWRKALDLFHWSVDISAPIRDKCVICVAPHTSNWDFILGLCAYRSLGRKANFLMKEFWFFFPLKYLLRALGGIPVPSAKGSALTASIVERFNSTDYMNLAVTPEGTRSYREEWRKGFLYIAYGAGVPIQLGIIDYARKTVEIKNEYTPTGNIDIDMKFIRGFYDKHHDAARIPSKFARLEKPNRSTHSKVNNDSI